MWMQILQDCGDMKMIKTLVAAAAERRGARAELQTIDVTLARSATPGVDRPVVTRWLPSGWFCRTMGAREKGGGPCRNSSRPSR